MADQNFGVFVNATTTQVLVGTELVPVIVSSATKKALMSAVATYVVSTVSTHFVPTGGTTGQSLVKVSNTNYDTTWATVSGAQLPVYTSPDGASPGDVGTLIAIVGGDGNDTGNGALIALTAGDSGVGATGDGGGIFITAGTAQSTNGAGGGVTFAGGNGSGSGQNGGVTFQVGTGGAVAGTIVLGAVVACAVLVDPISTFFPGQATSTAEGAFWYDASAHAFKGRNNSTTITFGSGGGTVTTSAPISGDGSGGSPVTLAADADGSFYFGGGSAASGIRNVALGASAAQSLTSATYCVAIGYQAMQNKTAGNDCVAIGRSTLQNATAGSGNIAIGELSLNTLTTGSDNVAIGDDVMDANTSGFYNVGIGGFDNNGVLNKNTTGARNTAIGTDAGSVVTTGSNNTFLGYGADTTKATLSKGIAIGSGAVVVNNNQCVIGGTSTDAVCIGFSGATAPADADIATSQAFFYWDFTPSAELLKVKGKDSGGTVFSLTLGGVAADVVGPGSATDGAVALYDGTTGKLLKDGFVPATVASTGSYTDLTSTPTLGTAAALDVGAGAFNVVQLDSSAYLTLPTTAVFFPGQTPSAVEGSLWYDTTDHVLKFYDGTTVKTVATV